MTSIRSFSEILLEEPDISERQRQHFVGTIHQESLRLTKLLDEILDLSALERGERTWENTPTDPEAALDRALVVCEAALRQHGVRLELGERVASVVRVEGDADRLCQVFINLVINAIRYNDSPNPVVRVQSALRQGAYAVEVLDNGPGIPRNERTLIFEKFSRGKRGLSEKGGAGLGLAISRQIVERMHGSLELVDGSLPGACFRVRLQLAC